MRYLGHYMLRQWFITNRDGLFITKCHNFITSCDSYYKIRRYYILRQYTIQFQQKQEHEAHGTGFSSQKSHNANLPITSMDKIHELFKCISVLLLIYELDHLIWSLPSIFKVTFSE